MKPAKNKARLILWLMVLSVFIAVHVVLLLSLTEPVADQSRHLPAVISKPDSQAAQNAPAAEKAIVLPATDADELAERAAFDLEEMTEDISDIFDSDWAEAVE